VFPKYDHVAVGTGTVVNKTSIKQYQQVCVRACACACVCVCVRACVRV